MARLTAINVQNEIASICVFLASAVPRFLAIHTAKAVTPAKAGVSFAYWNVQKRRPELKSFHKTCLLVGFFWNVKTYGRASLHASRL